MSCSAFAALPLLPVGAVSLIWPLLCQNAPIGVHGVAELITYMECTWIRPATALFSVTLWNQFQNTGPGTNNRAEGFYHKLNKRVRVAHPNVYDLIKVFKELQQENEVRLERLHRGERPRLARKKFREVNERIARLKADLISDSIDVFDYLDECSLLVKLGG